TGGRGAVDAVAAQVGGPGHGVPPDGDDLVAARGGDAGRDGGRRGVGVGDRGRGHLGRRLGLVVRLVDGGDLVVVRRAVEDVVVHIGGAGVERLGRDQVRRGRRDAGLGVAEDLEGHHVAGLAGTPREGDLRVAGGRVGADRG